MRDSVRMRAEQTIEACIGDSRIEPRIRQHRPPHHRFVHANGAKAGQLFETLDNSRSFAAPVSCGHSPAWH